ncbi:methyl-CpG-binding domain protein 2 [Tetranychus urticae]|uniref:Methyl-CpG binding protein 2/3 C-terminal domain-containing protein n=1 Tax=Tetranychus urticae TaxID=32264 RepID=T1L1A0_TETUR|nr:methyl-CpG-binding domain protein 2 [Tetranychus urticae]
MDQQNQQNLQTKDVKLKKKHRGGLSRIRRQPVTIVRSQNTGTTRHDLGRVSSQKPQQLFWQKRLEGLKATTLRSDSVENADLPKNIKPAGPYIGNDTAFRSVINAIHLHQGPIIGQTAGKNVLDKNPGVFLDPKQPLVGTIIISNDDIRKQEEKVNLLRRKLALALQDYEKR